MGDYANVMSESGELFTSAEAWERTTTITITFSLVIGAAILILVSVEAFEFLNNYSNPEKEREEKNENESVHLDQLKNSSNDIIKEKANLVARKRLLVDYIEVIIPAVYSLRSSLLERLQNSIIENHIFFAMFYGESRYDRI